MLNVRTATAVGLTSLGITRAGGETDVRLDVWENEGGALPGEAKPGAPRVEAAEAAFGSDPLVDG
jgi:hypothetical protein